MAVIISDMNEVPMNCFECDLHNYHFCNLTGNCIESNIDNNTRADDCSLKEVSECEVENCISKADFVEQIEKNTIVLQDWQKALIYKVMDDLPSVYPKSDNRDYIIREDAFMALTGDITDCSIEEFISRLRDKLSKLPSAKVECEAEDYISRGYLIRDLHCKAQGERDVSVKWLEEYLKTLPSVYPSSDNSDLEEIKKNRYNQGFYDGYKTATKQANAVIDNIKAEIQKEYLSTGYREDYWKAIDNVLAIIDNHISGKE